MPDEVKILWQAVIERAVKDARGYDCNPWDKKKARNWILEDSPDFQTVCDLAKISPDTVRKMLKKKC